MNIYLQHSFSGSVRSSVAERCGAEGLRYGLRLRYGTRLTVLYGTVAVRNLVNGSRCDSVALRHVHMKLVRLCGPQQ